MTPRQQRMIEDIQLRGLSERTQDASVRAVRQLAAHSHTSPARITAEALRADFLSLKNVKPSARRASTMALGGITFFSEHPLKCAGFPLTLVRASREKKLPVILSVEEVRTLLAPLRLRRSRACLTTIDSWGLRLQEGTTGKVPTWTVPACACPCGGAKVPRTAMCRCRHAPWISCVRPGKRPAIPCGSSPLQAVAESACPRHPPLCHVPVCRRPSGGPANTAVSISVPRCTPCATALRRRCLRPASLCASSRTLWDTTRQPPPPSPRLSPSKSTPGHVMPSRSS